MKERSTGSRRLLNIPRNLSILSCILSLSLVCGCAQPSTEQSGSSGSAKSADPALLALHPDSTEAGKPFNVQSSGLAGLAVTTKGAKNTSVIVFAGQSLATVFGGEALLTTEVPPALYAKQGKY